jgi:hypothetical protein
MFGFFSTRLGCIGSLIVSIVGSLLLMFILRGCSSSNRLSRSDRHTTQRVAAQHHAAWYTALITLS